MNKQFSFQDKRHLEAAEGWLGLGDHEEANEELECITAKMRAHPEVLRVRYEVYAKAKKWGMAAEIAQAICQIVPHVPLGWIHLAYALHELKRTKEAWDVLLPAIAKFPAEYIIRYNLACYASQLGNQKDAFELVEKAIEMAGTKEMKLMSLYDPDLEPLWAQISEI